VLPDGTTFNDRAAQKFRSGEPAATSTPNGLVALGATPRGDDPRRWLSDGLAIVGARRLQHPGCHRYCTTLGTRRTRHQLTAAHTRPATALQLW
jgi:hypothetical protein